MFNVKQKLLELASRQYHLQLLKADLKKRLALADLQRRQLSRNEQYFYCVYFFDHFLPESFKNHRRYFSTESMNKLFQPSNEEVVKALLELESA